MKDLLMEIGLEEVPALYMPAAIQDLHDIAKNKLAEHHLPCGQIQVWGTARRLTVLVSDLAEIQDDVSIQNRGPKKNLAFDDSGQPTKPGLGFAKAQGMDFKDLVDETILGMRGVAAEIGLA